MRKLILLSLAFILLLSFASCSDNSFGAGDATGAYINGEMEKVNADFKKLQEYGNKASGIIAEASALLDSWNNEGQTAEEKEKKCKDIVYSKNSAYAQIEMYTWKTTYYDSLKGSIDVALEMIETNMNSLKALASGSDEAKLAEIKESVSSAKSQIDDIMKKLK